MLLEAGDEGPDQVLGQPAATHAQLKATEHNVSIHLYGRTSYATMNEALARFYLGREKLQQLKKLSPSRLMPTVGFTSPGCRYSYIEVLLWKAAGQRDPPLLRKLCWKDYRKCPIVLSMAATSLRPVMHYIPLRTPINACFISHYSHYTIISHYSPLLPIK